MDVADSQRNLAHGMSFRDFVIHSSSQFCASYFDEGQAQNGPDRTGGLFSSWLRHAQTDQSPSLLMGLRGYRKLVSELPETVEGMASLALTELAIPQEERERYLTGLLLDLNGWAAWCAYRRWTARLSGGQDDAIVDLLGMRLAWEWLLYRAGGPRLAPAWRFAVAAWPASDAMAGASQSGDWVLQKALELSWQQQVVRAFPHGLATPAPASPAVQAVFCIDVRSEVFRRALETETDAVQTLGFAGFFGLPIEYQPVASANARPQLPGLLAARLRVTDEGVPADLADRRGDRLAVGRAWKDFKTNAVSSFSFIESMGIFYAGQLLSESLGKGTQQSTDCAGLTSGENSKRKPRVTAFTDGRPVAASDRTDVAAGMLTAMSLTHDFARLVLLTGHGSETRNNPHAAGLDCGACCGQTGEVNARAAAALLNQPDVRAGLAARGIDVPESTYFLGALHNTTTDDVTLFDLDEAPGSHAEDLMALRAWLAAASGRAREERASRLDLNDLNQQELHASVRARANDWAEVRPEWGLANNAAFIVAPREHCRHLDLSGRSFLHDYRFEEDTDFAILELIMTAPMVVTHWINLQYYASTVDNARYGSGNKVLHNVVGGHLGVFEGNGGDLRIGLPLQSLHDGEQWVHTPLRLSVFIEAPGSAIEAVLAKHEKVRALVDNGWLDLFRIDAAALQVQAYRERLWVPAATASAGFSATNEPLDAVRVQEESYT